LFVRAAIERGWEAYSTEVSGSCCKSLRPLLGERLHHGELSGASFEASSFDIVVMMEVVEHLIEPREYLLAAQRLLRRGGCLWVTTPNIVGVSGRLMGTSWRVFSDEHLNYFNPTSIEFLLNQCGFTDIVVRTTSIDMPAFSQLLRHGLFRGKPTSAPVLSRNPQNESEKTDRLARMNAMVVDRSMQVVNRLLGLVSMGDSLKIVAVRS
jgi:hypothetical protein